MKILNTIGFFLKDHAPEILVGSGIIFGVGAVVTAATSTPKAIAAKQQMDSDLMIIHAAHGEGKTATGEEYTEEDYKKDLIGGYVQGIGRCVRPYIPTILLTTASIVCTLGGFGILKKRHAATLAILSSTVSQFDAYRSRVKAELGADKEHDVYWGLKDMTKEELEILEENDLIPENTGDAVVKKLDSTIDCPALLGPYAIRLDRTNPSFQINRGDPLYVDSWLSIMESTLNTQLHMRGFLYLAEVLNELNVTKETYPNLDTDIIHQVGWIDGYKDGVIDFGCWRTDENGKKVLSIVTGVDGCVYLDFNCSPILGLTKDVKTSSQKKMAAWRENPIVEK